MPTVEVGIRRVIAVDHPIACSDNPPQLGNLIEYPRLQDLRPAERFAEYSGAALDRSARTIADPRGLNNR